MITNETIEKFVLNKKYEIEKTNQILSKRATKDVTSLTELIAGAMDNMVSELNKTLNHNSSDLTQIMVDGFNNQQQNIFHEHSFAIFIASATIILEKGKEYLESRIEKSKKIISKKDLLAEIGTELPDYLINVNKKMINDMENRIKILGNLISDLEENIFVLSSKVD